MTDYDDAKKMFSYYNGNGFYMAKEGEWDKYKKFKIPRAVEVQWLNEMFHERVDKLQRETVPENMVNWFSLIGENIIDLMNCEYIDVLKEFIDSHFEKVDHFSGLRLIENYLGVARKFDKETLLCAARHSLPLLQAIDPDVVDSTVVYGRIMSGRRERVIMNCLSIIGGQ